MIKLKKLLKEGTFWDRKFGEPLPTLEDTMKRHNKNKREELLKEVDDDEEIVAQIEDDAKLIIKNIKDMNKFIKKGKKVPGGNIKNIRGLLDDIQSLTEIL